MAVQQEDLPTQEQYASDTGLRMKQVAAQLLDIEQARVRNAANLHCQLHQQEEASRLAGFIGISRLCRQMQDCLKTAQEGGLPQLRVAARTLLDVCRAIEVHALGAGGRIATSSTLEACCLAEAN
jgi:hypothetical protein